MKNFEVTVPILGTITYNVKAKDKEDAKDKAYDMYDKKGLDNHNDDLRPDFEQADVREDPWGD